MPRGTFHRPGGRIRTSVICFSSKMCQKIPLIASITQTAKALRQSTLWQRLAAFKRAIYKLTAGQVNNNTGLGAILKSINSCNLLVTGTSSCHCPAGNAQKGRAGGEGEGSGTGCWDECGAAKGWLQLGTPEPPVQPRDGGHPAVPTCCPHCGIWPGSGGPVMQDKGGSGGSSGHTWSLPSAQTYLGFIDRAVQCVVFLIVEQAEIQRPQRGCKGENM